jgi:predicted AAA+ superfamily ATPase
MYFYEKYKKLMERNIYYDLLKWKNSDNRKPLILQGARQVGKTWVMKEFGRKEFKHIAYFNFEDNDRLKTLFIPDFDINRIIAVLEIELGSKIDLSDTLLIFDEIQEAERGLTSLKYFYEKSPNIAIIAAGSLIGVAIQKKNLFPVGKVDFLKMYPLNFAEFLEATSNHLIKEKLEARDWIVLSHFHEKLTDLLRLYYFTGGMPEVVSNYLKNRDLNIVRKIQQGILESYENDFGKYAPIQLLPRIRLVWQHIISQLARENKKFIYGQVVKGSRAEYFEMAIEWLCDAGLLLKSNINRKPAIPLSAYTNMDSFKLFYLDVGLLNCMAKVEPQILLQKNNILTEFKGAMTEQFVAQQLKINFDLYYWSAQNATASIDFMIQKGSDIIAIEVKAEENLKSKKLKVFHNKYNETKAVRFSMSPYREQDWMLNIPLYGVSTL